MLCRVLGIARSTFYQRLHQPKPPRQLDNERLVELIGEFHEASSCVSDSPRIFQDLRKAGETCSLNRVARRMRAHRIQAQTGYRRPRMHGGRHSRLAPNRLQRAFSVSAPNEAWATDITNLRSHEGSMYLAVVIDLYSRKVIGWSMQRTLDRSLAINAPFLAVRRRSPKGKIIIHSDKGSQ